ncbi:hypothetical protein RRF57_012338 [Xylaria bambusicola]|uniref:Uncharacterized protein n=1 Tax=Xylaria bambusicola TaxID=326684 RepID=A0AAN7UV14_9PEZI
MKDGKFLLRVNLRTEENEAIRLAQARFHGGTAATNHNFAAGVINYLEMIREPQAFVEFRDR